MIKEYEKESVLFVSGQYLIEEHWETNVLKPKMSS